MTDLAPNEFRCAVCKEVFEKGWSQEEAVAEMEALWGKDMTTAQCEEVCDDCFKRIGLG